VSASLSGSALVAFLGTSDLRRSDDFYGEVLGLKRLDSSSFANLYAAAGATLRVTLVEKPARASYTVTGWKVEDISAAISALGERGIEFRHYPGFDQTPEGVWTAPSGSRIAWFEDTDGNMLSLEEAPEPRT
jgi:catechol 2,3-dioxygenase-like lactoylglutathione lyase family enzyme